MSRRRRATAALPDTGCHNCRHWREDLDAAAADERRGECHFHPPTVLWDAEEAAVFSARPTTAAAESCALHAPRLQ